MRFRYCTLLLIVAATTSIAIAEVTNEEYYEARGVHDRFSVSIGAFATDFDTRARLDSDLFPDSGTEISFEDDLDFNADESNLRLDGYWRFSRKNRIEFGLMRFTRDARADLEEEIQWGDEVYDLDATVKAETEMDVIKFAYKHSFIANGRVTAGISVGLNAMLFDAELTEIVAGVGEDSQSEDLIAPVPMIGAHFEYTIVPRLIVRGSWELFDVEVEDLEARVIDWRASLDWYPFDHFGLGVGYNVVNIEVEDTGAPAFLFDYDYDGPQAYLSLIF